MGDKAAIGAVLGAAGGAVSGFLMGGGPVGAIVMGIVGGATGGIQGHQVDKQEDAVEAQKAQDAKNAELAQQSNYRNSVAAIQQAARGISAQKARQVALDREPSPGTDAFKEKHTPYKAAGGAKTSQTSAQVVQAFSEMRGTRPNGKVAAKLH